MRHLLKVHERDIVDMTVALPLEDHSWRKTLVAHTLGVRTMLLFAIFVYFIAEALSHRTILTFLMGQMLVFALLFLL